LPDPVVPLKDLKPGADERAMATTEAANEWS